MNLEVSVSSMQKVTYLATGVVRVHVSCLLHICMRAYLFLMFAYVAATKFSSATAFNG